MPLLSEIRQEGSQSSFYMWKLKSCRPVSRTAVVRIGQVWGCKKDGSIC